MPSALESLAALIQDPALVQQSATRVDRLRLHIADTLGMMLEGASLADGRVALSLITPLGDARNPMQWDDVLAKVAARHRPLLTAIRRWE